LTTYALTAEQRAGGAGFLPPGGSWGLQVGLDTAPTVPGATPARFGWDGGTGCSGWADPGADLVAVLLTNRGMADPGDFWRALYGCL
jgi:CubicO group peptidase (beta-lactamase class C family)